MPALNFTVFIDKILAGEKCQTIRPPRKRPIKQASTVRRKIQPTKKSKAMKGLVLTLLLFASSVQVSEAVTYINTTDITFTLSATDALSGVKSMQFSNDGITWSTPEDYATEKNDWEITPGDGQKTVSVKVMDNAGNWSEPASVSFVLDTTPPENGSIDVQVKITMGVVQLKFSKWFIRDALKDETFKSPEQFWLAFAMKEKFQKTWNGKDWEEK